MNKLWQKTGEVIRHNVPLMVAIVCVVCLLIWGVGCQSTTQSLVTPNLRVNRAKLHFEYNSEIARLEQERTQLGKLFVLRDEDLDWQDNFKQQLFDMAVPYIQTGKLNPLGLATSSLSLLCLGSLGNGLVKDRVIKTMKSSNNKT